MHGRTATILIDYILTQIVFIAQEAQIVVAAGMVTTAYTLAIATYNLLANPQKLNRLRDELCFAMPDPKDPQSLVQLEGLPYLTAVIHESLRLSYGVAHRLARVSPDTALKYGDWVIPPGVPVSMTSVMMHNNTVIFPEPEKFRPERWLPKETDGQRLLKYLVPFAKGSRSCLGMNLAYAEFMCVWQR